jgi:branched-chain amino acid transport system substrate-binding protein
VAAPPVPGQPAPPGAVVLGMPGVPGSPAIGEPLPGAAPALSLPPPPLPPVPAGGARIAVLLPLSGSSAQLGADMLNAVELALFDFADEGFELIIHDTGSTPEMAAQAAKMAVADGAQLVLGPLTAASTVAVAEVAIPASINVVSFSADRAVAGGGVNVMGFLPGDQVQRVVSYTASRGLGRFAALAPDTPYGRTVIAALQESARLAGGQVVRTQIYSPSTTDFNAMIKQLADYDARRGALLAQRRELAGHEDELSKRALARLENLQTIGDLPFDALLVADGGNRLEQIAALLPYYDVDPRRIRMLGTMLWDEAGPITEPALVGGWFAAPAPAERRDFETRFRATFGRAPRRLATLAYDAAALAWVLSQTPRGPDFSAAAIADPRGFLGQDGIFRFRPDGTVERGLAVLQVGRDGERPIDPAPQSFGPLIN